MMNTSKKLLFAVACILAIALTVAALRYFHSTSQAGAGRNPPLNNSDVSTHSFDPPAIYFYDADGNRMTPLEAQEFLIALDYRDNEGRKIKADGAPGTSTWQAWCKYVGDCHAAETFKVSSILEVE